jgi:hypothetical protein
MVTTAQTLAPQPVRARRGRHAEDARVVGDFVGADGRVGIELEEDVIGRHDVIEKDALHLAVAPERAPDRGLVRAGIGIVEQGTGAAAEVGNDLL